MFWLTYDGGKKGSSPTAPIGSGNYERKTSGSKETLKASQEDYDRLSEKLNELEDRLYSGHKKGESKKELKKQAARLENKMNDIEAELKIKKYSVKGMGKLGDEYNKAVREYFKTEANFFHLGDSYHYDRQDEEMEKYDNMSLKVDKLRRRLNEKLREKGRERIARFTPIPE